MNFYNPYYYNIPTSLAQPKVGLLTRLFGSAGTSIGGFLNGTQKVLNIANQTIPLVKQVRPMIGNAKTVFKVMNEFKKVNLPNNLNEINTENQNNINKTNIDNTVNIDNTINNTEEGPTFFV